jgi:peptide/nickel transport system permease protein
MGFVESARSIGVSDKRIIFGEILPNALGPIIVTWTLDVGFAILLEAGLSFIGLGDINFPSWGFMLQKSMRFITQAWWMSFFPGLAIFLVVFAFNLVGDGLNDALSPKLERLEETGEQE